MQPLNIKHTLLIKHGMKSYAYAIVLYTNDVPIDFYFDPNEKIQTQYNCVIGSLLN